MTSGVSFRQRHQEVDTVSPGENVFMFIDILDDALTCRIGIFNGKVVVMEDAIFLFFIDLDRPAGIAFCGKGIGVASRLRSSCHSQP